MRLAAVPARGAAAVPAGADPAVTAAGLLDRILMCCLPAAVHGPLVSAAPVLLAAAPGMCRQQHLLCCADCRQAQLAQQRGHAARCCWRLAHLLLHHLAQPAAARVATAAAAAA